MVVARYGKSRAAVDSSMTRLSGSSVALPCSLFRVDARALSGYYSPTKMRGGHSIPETELVQIEGEGVPLRYSEMNSIEPGLRFKTIGGLIVETTGQTQSIDSVQVYVHEVVIVEGVGEGNRYLHNLDSAEQL